MDTQFIQPSAIRAIPSLSNIMGVTALSRACLRRLFSESGLFGAEQLCHFKRRDRAAVQDAGVAGPTSWWREAQTS